jgi:hypothetical protein
MPKPNSNKKMPLITESDSTSGPGKDRSVKTPSLLSAATTATTATTATATTTNNNNNNNNNKKIGRHAATLVESRELYTFLRQSIVAVVSNVIHHLDRP